MEEAGTEIRLSDPRIARLFASVLTRPGAAVTVTSPVPESVPVLESVIPLPWTILVTTAWPAVLVSMSCRWMVALVIWVPLTVVIAILALRFFRPFPDKGFQTVRWFLRLIAVVPDGVFGAFQHQVA